MVGSWSLNFTHSSFPQVQAERILRWMMYPPGRILPGNQGAAAGHNSTTSGTSGIWLVAGGAVMTLGVIDPLLKHNGKKERRWQT